MVAGGVSGYPYDINTFNKQLLKNIGAPVNPQTLGYLQSWEGHEGHGRIQDIGFNPLATMQGGYGGMPTPGTQGNALMSYPSLQAGAAAEAAAIQNGLYPQLLSALRAGTPQYGNPYGGEISTWSGSGYPAVTQMPYSNTDPLSNYQNAQVQQNLPGAITSAVQAGNIGNQQMINQLMSGQAANFARQESGFQLQNIGLSQQQLGIQQGALQRQLGLVPRERQLETRQFRLQEQGLKASRADIQREYKNQFTQLASSAAGSGSLFTKGTRDTRHLMGQREASSLAAIGRQQASLGLTEKGAALNFKEHMAALKDEKKNYGILAKRYGISEQEVKARLQNTLQELNLSSMSTASDLASALVGANMQTWSALNPAIPFGFPMTGGTSGVAGYTPVGGFKTPS